MSLDSLPPELLATVVDFLRLEPNSRLAVYACISKSWQQAVERQTFASLRIASDNLSDFEDLVAVSHEHRRSNLREIHFSVKLPSYHDKACARFETRADQRTNDETFTAAIVRLYSALANCERVEKPSPIALHIQEVFSPMDLSHRGPEKYAADRDAYELGRRMDLWEHRYEHSYIQLLEPEKLPQLKRVALLSVFADSPRYIAPASAATLASSLPELNSITWKLADGERKLKCLRTKLRTDFGTALGTLRLASLRSLELSCQCEAPSNEYFMPASANDSTNGDMLSAGLGDFLRSQPMLGNVTLGGPICIGPEFFLPRDCTTAEQWSHIKELRISFSTVSPNGGWYFERDPETSDNAEDEGLSNPGTPDEPSEDESGSGYDTEESFFDQDEPAPETYNDLKEQRLRGQDRTETFRTHPNIKCEELLLSIARAVTYMPRLTYMAVGADMQPCSRTAGQIQTFEFEYAVKGVSNWKDQSPGDVDSARLYWTAPKGWRMSEHLELAWKSVVGQESIVRYEEW